MRASLLPNDSSCLGCRIRKSICDWPQSSISAERHYSARDRFRERWEADRHSANERFLAGWKVVEAAGHDTSLEGPNSGTKDCDSQGARDLGTLPIPAKNNAVIQAPLSLRLKPIYSDKKVKPQCFEHDCDGKTFPNFADLFMHQNRELRRPPTEYCSNCRAKVTWKAATMCIRCKERESMLERSKISHIAFMNRNEIGKIIDLEPSLDGGSSDMTILPYQDPHELQPELELLRSGRKELDAIHRAQMCSRGPKLP